MSQRTYTSLVEWDCAVCGEHCSRPPTKGQRPKYCSPRCSARRERDWSYKRSALCCDCNQTIWQGQTRCGECNNLEFIRRRSVPKAKPSRLPADRRGKLRQAIEGGDHSMVIELIRRRCDTTSGCWVWQGQLKGGYAHVSIDKHKTSVHRLVLEAKHGARLGTQHAHHTCANSSCVNPDHLQPVTHRDNVAEMLARHSYVARIRELEQALADVDPLHPALAVIDVA